MGNDRHNLSVWTLAGGPKGVRDSVSSSTEFEKRDFSQCVWNALIRVYKGWKGRVSFHMKVDQVRKQERMIERRELESDRCHG